MTGKFKTGIRALSVLLTVVILIGILPMSVFAEKVNDYEATRSITGALEADEKSEIVSELPSKRDEYTKVFLRTDGTQTAIISGAPLHYEKEGKWENIDNTLEKKTVNGESVFQNKAGAFTVSLPCELKDSSAVAVENKGYTLSFSLQSEKLTNKSSVKAQMEDKRAEKAVTAAQSSDAYAAAGFEDKESAVVFESVEKDTDIQYIVTPTGLKENIILNKKPQSGVSYIYEINADGLTGALNEDNSIDFKNANGEVIFNLPAPFMFDANDEQTYDVEVTFTGSGSTYIMTYTPSYEWLSDSKRKYPVTIDPVVQTLKDGEGLYDTYANSGTPTTTWGTSPNMYVGRKDGNVLRSYSQFSYPALFAFSANVSKVTYNAYITYSDTLTVNAYAVLEDWEEGTLTYNAQPGCDETLVDYKNLNSERIGNFISFDITKAFMDVFTSDTVFYGIQLKSDNENNTGYCRFNSTNYTGDTAYLPYIEIEYYETNGLSDIYDYHSHDVGRAGTIYINDFNNQLYFEREELGIDGEVMPVHIKRYYSGFGINSINALLQGISSSCGQFWTMNYNQFIEYNNFMYNGEDRILYINGEGVAIYYKYDSTDGSVQKWVEETFNHIGDTGTSLNVPENCADNIPDNLDKVEVVNAEGQKLKFYDSGFLKEIISADNENDKIIITYVAAADIDTITDGVGRKYKFSYYTESGVKRRLTSIQAYDANNNPIKVKNSSGADVDYKITYGGTSSLITTNFTSATYPDGKTVYYDTQTTSNPDNIMTVTNIDGYRLEYTAKNGVYKITEKVYDPLTSSYVTGDYINITSQDAYQKTFTDRYGNIQIKQFDRFGRTVSVQDENGNCTYAKYTDEDIEGKTYNILSDITQTDILDANELFNHSFEQDFSNWTIYTSILGQASTISTLQSHIGQKSLFLSRLVKGNIVCNQGYKNVSPGETYMLSAYMKISGTMLLGTADLFLEAKNGDTILSTIRTTGLKTTNNEWVRVELTATLPANTDNIQIYAAINNGLGSVYFDDINLRKVKTDDTVNLIQNSDFTSDKNGWTTSAGTAAQTTDANNGVRASSLSAGVISLTGARTTATAVSQDITLTDVKIGDTYSFGGWAKTLNGLPVADGSKSFSMKVFGYIDTVYEEIGAIVFNPYLDNWQYCEKDFTLEKQYTKLKLSLFYEYQAIPQSGGSNIAFFDGIRLVKTGTGTGEQQGGGEEHSGSCECEYCAGNCHCTHTEGPCNSTTCPECGTCVCENCEQENCPCRCANASVCTHPQCKRYTKETKNSHGSVLTNNQYNAYYENEVLKTEKLVSQNTYTGNGNYISSVKDTNGLTTSYNTNINNGRLSSVTQNGNTVSFTHNNTEGYMTRLSQSVSGLSNGSSIATQYGYTDDRLTSITHNGFTYHIEYDIWGSQTAVKLGSQTLVSYEYDTVYHSRLNTITYANGDTVHFTYDTKGTVTSTTKNGAELSAYEYAYSDGNLSRVTDNESGFTTVYTDDAVKIYSGETLVYSSVSSVNANENTVITESFAGKTYTLTQNDGVFDIQTGKTTSTSTLTGYGGKNIELSSVSDYFGRKTQEDIAWEIEEGQGYTVGLDLREIYGYKTLDGASNTTSSLVENYSFDIGMVLNITDPSQLEEPEILSYDGVFMKYSGTDFCYEYDGKGNIIREYTLNENEDEVSRYDYTYDEAGQLTRADDAVQSKSFTYTYDIGGNIVSKKEYDYTTGMLGTVIDTKNYTYDTVWKDKLASYDGNVINYDQMGNPMNYISKDVSENDVAGMLEYDGRQLVKATNISENCEYVYNENGLMSKKLVYNNYDIDSNGKIIFFDLQSTYTYYWNDSKLMGYTLVNSSDGSFFNVKVIYGADGEPLGYTITGDNDFEMGFVYTKNLQGDITGIYTLEGTSCLLFSYDAYGIPTYTVGDSFIGAWLSLVLNPFLYRGYMYDINTGLYYLQSRYYNPIYGRFLNADETGILQVAQGEVHGANLFAYCNNNPIRFIDTSGRVALLVIIKIIIEIVVVLEILNFFFSAHSFYKEILETMRIHTRNVLAVGIEKNYNVNLQVFGYFSKKNYARHCLESYETLKFYTDILGITNSYTKDDVEALKATMIGWDRYVFYNIIKFYLKKLIFFGYVTIFTDFTL